MSQSDKRNDVAVSGPDGTPVPVDPEDIKADIERTRAELSQTVEALAHKMNVPEQVKAKVHDTTATVQAKAVEVQAKVEVAADQALVKLPPAARQPAHRALTAVLANPVQALLGTLGGLILLRILLRRRSR
jgi:Protein of unknown function (DUF3618)